MPNKSKVINSGISDYWFSYKENQSPPITVYDKSNRIFCNRYQSFTVKSFLGFTTRIIRRGVFDVKNGQYYYGNPWENYQE